MSGFGTCGFRTLFCRIIIRHSGTQTTIAAVHRQADSISVPQSLLSITTQSLTVNAQNYIMLKHKGMHHVSALFAKALREFGWSPKDGGVDIPETWFDAFDTLRTLIETITAKRFLPSVS